MTRRWLNPLGKGPPVPPSLLRPARSRASSAGRLPLPRTLRGQLILLVLVVLLPVLAVQTAIYVSWFRAQRAQAVQNNLELARAVSAGFREYVENVRLQESVTGMAIAHLVGNPPGDVTRVLSFDAAQYLGAFHWISTSGVVLASSEPGAVGLSVADQQYFRDLLAGRDWTLSDLLRDEASSEPIFIIASVVRDDSGVPLGVVAASLPGAVLGRITFRFDRPSDGRITLRDRTGALAFASSALPGDSWPGGGINEDPILRRALSGVDAYGVYVDPATGLARTTARVPIPDCGWIAGASRPERAVLGGLIRSLAATAGLTAAITAFSLFVALRLARGTLLALNRLRDHAVAIGRGDLSVRTEVAGASELADLAVAFNLMTQRLQEEIAERDRARADTESIARFPAENPSPVLRISADGTLLYANAAAATLLDVWGWRIGAPVDESWRRVAADASLAGQSREMEVEFGQLTLSFTFAPVPLSGYVNAYGFDVTERNRGRAALQELAASLETRVVQRTADLRAANELLETVFSNIHLLIAYMDPSFNFISVNRAFAAAAGRSPESFAGRNFFDLFPGGEARSIFSDVVHTRAAFVAIEQPFASGEFPGRPNAFWDWSLQPVLDASGDVSGLILALRDVTEQTVAKQELARYQRRLRAMASELVLSEESIKRGIAKDLHDQVGQALAYCHISLSALAEQVPPELSQQFHEVGLCLEGVIRAARALTFELGSPLLYELGLEPAVERLTEELQREHSVPISFRDDGRVRDFPDDVRATLYSALRELLANVVEHSRASRAAVSFGGDSRSAVITVEDDGIGFDPSAVARTARGDGACGLFSSRERLEYLGCTLAVESAPGSGTRVTITAPLRTGDTATSMGQ